MPQNDFKISYTLIYACDAEIALKIYFLILETTRQVQGFFEIESLLKRLVIFAHCFMNGNQLHTVHSTICK